MKLKNGYLVRKVKKTANRKKWLSLVLFIVILLPIFLQLYFVAIDYFNEQTQFIIKQRNEKIESYLSQGLSEEDAFATYKNEVMNIYATNSAANKDAYIANYKTDDPSLTDEQAEEKFNDYVKEQGDVYFNQIEDLVNGNVIDQQFYDPMWLFTLLSAEIYFLVIHFSSKRQKKKPYTHKIFRNLKFGRGQLENLQQFEDEMTARNIPEYGHVLITDHWLFYDGYLRIKLRHVDEVVCVCKVRTRSKSFLTRWASRKKDIIIGFADKTQWVVKFGKDTSYVDEFKDMMIAKIPHLVAGDDDGEIFKVWSTNPDEIISRYAQNKYRINNAKTIEENKVAVKNENERKEKIVEKDSPNLSFGGEE